MASAADIAIALRVLKAAANDDALREELSPAVNTLNKRSRQKQRQKSQAAKQQQAEAPPATSAAPILPSADGVVTLAAPHLSRILYPNPVCFLSTWKPGTSEANLMTISWLAPIDNDGRFFLSMNQRRHSARLLSRHPYLVLSVACAGLEQLLTRVGGCTGARVHNKPKALGVPLCRPGWAPLPPAEDDEPSPNADDAEVDAADEEAASANTGSASSWPTNSDDTLVLPWSEAPSEDELTRGLADAIAVAPCAAHVCARVVHGRAAHGHYLLTLETVAAFVREEYWSGKTLEPQKAGVPPILSFFGSQRFGHVKSAQEAADVS